MNSKRAFEIIMAGSFAGMFGMALGAAIGWVVLMAMDDAAKNYRQPPLVPFSIANVLAISVACGILAATAALVFMASAKGEDEPPRPPPLQQPPKRKQPPRFPN